MQQHPSATSNARPLRHFREVLIDECWRLSAEWTGEVAYTPFLRQLLVGCSCVSCFTVGLSLPACDETIQHVRIAAQDYRFQPALVRVHAEHPFRLTIVNEGREAHEFSTPLFSQPTVRRLAQEPPELAIDQGHVRIYPGRFASVTISAPAGTYWYRCVIPGHRGMEGMLIVE